MTALAKIWQQGRPSLARPAVVVALGLLIANDQVFKLQFPGWVTGKLSDAAGLFVLGALLAWLWPRKVAGALAVAALAFAFWKSELSTPWIAAWNQTDILRVARVVDLTDLLALPCLALGARTVAGSLRPAGRWRRAPDLAVALVALLAFTATSRPLYDFKLRDHGGVRTVVYAGSPPELEAVLNACGIDWRQLEEGTVGLYLESAPGALGIDLRCTLRVTQGRTVLIFDRAVTAGEPEDHRALVDRSIAAIEDCLDPSEAEPP